MIFVMYFLNHIVFLPIHAQYKNVSNPHSIFYHKGEVYMYLVAVINYLKKKLCLNQ
jgi:hypothetical protein